MKPLVRSIKLLFVGAVLAVFTVTLVHGKTEYTKKEGKACIACHVKNGAKELNEVGKCYEKKKSLKDCETGGSGTPTAKKLGGQ
ncbi:MAG: hypothetical protein HY650_11880 [Acidobacteria bacterium]|nr:hypothetical protein [Acidobacteriota bacterium]